MSGAEPPGQDQLMREAAAWFARMRGPDAEASREAFESWLRRGALHRSAYNRAAEIFAMGKVLAEPKPVAPKQRWSRPRNILISLGAAALLAGLCALVSLTLSGSGLLPSTPAGRIAPAPVVATRLLTAEPGETRVLHLADGSRVRIHSDTILEARFGPSERRLHLKRGRARFEVHHDRRPFIVMAGGGSVTARGTLFDVMLAPDNRVTVRLISGLVDVDVPAANRAGSIAARRLSAGQSVSFAAQSAAGSGVVTSGGEAPALRAGSLESAPREYEAIMLGDLVAAANRSSRRPIRLGDASTASLRLSGRFRTDDTELLAERLSVLFDLSIDKSRQNEIVLRRR